MSSTGTQLPFWARCWRYFTRKVRQAYYFITDFLFARPAKRPLGLVNLSSKGCLGSTAIFFQLRPGVVLKAPAVVYEDQSVEIRSSVLPNFQLEQRILEHLGDHPRIVRFLGWYAEFPTGLLLAEATSSLQHVLDSHHDRILPEVRLKWFLQAIESIAYIHQRGIWHSDIRPDNFLVDGPDQDLRLCDFGGATCPQLGLSGNQLPDAGFFDPTAEWTPSPAVDIFSLGSTLYCIVTGHWPFRTPGGLFNSFEEMEAYEAYVEDHFRQGKFPCVAGLPGGDIILGCWTHKFSNMKDVLAVSSSL